MKVLTTYLIVCILFLTVSVTPKGGIPHEESNGVLADATAIRTRISRTVSSADARVGDIVDFEVLEDIKVGDTIVVSRGGAAFGTVTNAKPKGRMGKGGKLDISIDFVRLASGEKAPLRGSKDNKGGGRGGAMTGAIVATALVFWPAAPLFLFMKGKDITIPKGTEITVYVNGDVPIDVARFNPSKKSVEEVKPESASNASSVANAGLTINSIPGSADVEIDGKFVGNTPSTISLPAGERKITIKKNGYTSWERTITLSAGSNISLNAELEKIP